MLPVVLYGCETWSLTLRDEDRLRVFESSVLIFGPKREERAPGTHWIGGWVGPRAGLDAVMKRKIPSPRRESNPKPRIQRNKTALFI
jgi:hypothetical protein